MEKKKIEKTIFHKSKNTCFKWKDIKNISIAVEDDDEIMIGYEEAHYSEDNSYDAHFWLEIRRMVEETDEQYQNRIKREENMRKESNERRYQTYLKLKAEFEKE